MQINRERLIDTFCTLVRIDNPSGHEAAMAQHLIQVCTTLGLTCRQDAAGNVICVLDGTGEPLLLAAHMDSVTPAIGKEPVVRDGIIFSAGDTVLGADDLAGVTAIVEGVRAALDSGQPLRALEVVWTVQEESGLKGARALDYSSLMSKRGFAFDMSRPVGAICVASPARMSFEATVRGKAAHAGGAPEQGISAIKVAADAIAAMQLGRIDDETTCNLGAIHGGGANNIVPDRVVITGEVRSRSNSKLVSQWAKLKKALEHAATQHGAQIEIDEQHEYNASVLSHDAPVVQLAQSAMRAVGIEPQLVLSGGGSDVSIFTEHGIQAANLGIGYQNIHSFDEQIAVEEIERAATIVAYLATTM